MTTGYEKDGATGLAEEEEVVDADIIEAVKENIQPLQKGRRATALSAIFSTPHFQRETMLTRRRAQFRLQVKQALDDEEDDGILDPLDVYSRFVVWTMESYPQGQNFESGLVELLEEATRILKDREIYRQDLRYLKLWILYAGYVQKPELIYAFLLENEIGTELGQFYEEYADCLERNNLYKKADEIYRLGIARRVESVMHLKNRYSEFQRRMLTSRTQSNIPEETSVSSQTSILGPTAGQRKVLGETSRRQAVAPTIIDQSSRQHPNARMQIFIDPTGEAGVQAEQSAWPEVGTRISRTKENRPGVFKMADGPLRPGISSSVPTTTSRATFVPFRDVDTIIDPLLTSKSSFIPFQDEEWKEIPVRVETNDVAAPRIKQMGMTTEAEALRKDPFKNYR